jgi:hypothetical protein
MPRSDNAAAPPRRRRGIRALDPAVGRRAGQGGRVRVSGGRVRRGGEAAAAYGGVACSARAGLKDGRAHLSRPGPGRAYWRRFGAARRTSDTSRFPLTRLTVRRWRSRYTSAAGVPPRPPSAPFSPPHPLSLFLFLPLLPSLSFSLFISLQTRACARLHTCACTHTRAHTYTRTHTRARANLWPTRMRSPLTRHMEAERARSSDSEWLGVTRSDAK